MLGRMIFSEVKIYFFIVDRVNAFSKRYDAADHLCFLHVRLFTLRFINAISRKKAVG